MLWAIWTLLVSGRRLQYLSRDGSTLQRTQTSVSPNQRGPLKRPSRSRAYLRRLLRQWIRRLIQSSFKDETALRCHDGCQFDVHVLRHWTGTHLSPGRQQSTHAGLLSERRGKIRLRDSATRAEPGRGMPPSVVQKELCRGRAARVSPRHAPPGLRAEH